MSSRDGVVHGTGSYTAFARSGGVSTRAGAACWRGGGEGESVVVRQLPGPVAAGLGLEFDDEQRVGGVAGKVWPARGVCVGESRQFELVDEHCTGVVDHQSSKFGDMAEEAVTARRGWNGLVLFGCAGPTIRQASMSWTYSSRPYRLRARSSIGSGHPTWGVTVDSP